MSSAIEAMQNEQCSMNSALHRDSFIGNRCVDETIFLFTVVSLNLVPNMAFLVCVYRRAFWTTDYKKI